MGDGVETRFYEGRWGGVPATYVAGFVCAGLAILCTFMPWVVVDGEAAARFAAGSAQVAAGLASPSVSVEGQYAVFNLPAMYHQLGLESQAAAASAQLFVPWAGMLCVAGAGVAFALARSRSLRLLGVACVLIVLGACATAATMAYLGFGLTAWPLLSLALAVAGAWCCFSTRPRRGMYAPATRQAAMEARLRA